MPVDLIKSEYFIYMHVFIVRIQMEICKAAFRIAVILISLQ